MPRTKAQLEQLRAERREQIIQAALEVFMQKGYHAANVSDVAAKAEVSQGTIYHYFPGKEDLFLAAYESWEVQTLYREIHHSLDAAQSPGEQLHILAQTVGERLAQAAALLPANVEFWSHIPRNEVVQEGFRRMFAEMRLAVAQIIQDGVTQGEFAHVDPEMTAALLIAFYDGLILQWLADPRSVDWQDASAALIYLVFNGLQNPEKR